jgi:hypothetical protein
MYREDLGRNVTAILAQGVRFIQGTVPREVRRELMEAVKLKALGHLKKDGLKPETFFHPDKLHEARRRQAEEAEYAVKCIATVMAPMSMVHPIPEES